LGKSSRKSCAWLNKPRVQNHHTCRLKVRHIPCHHGESVLNGRGGNHRIPVRARVGDVQRCTYWRRVLCKRQDATRKSSANTPQPMAQSAALRRCFAAFSTSLRRLRWMARLQDALLSTRRAVRLAGTESSMGIYECACVDPHVYWGHRMATTKHGLECRVKRKKAICASHMKRKSLKYASCTCGNPPNGLNFKSI
jgi:hypothetical protein